MVYLGTNPICWSSRKQVSVSRFTIEAEYWALANTTSEVIWIQNLLHELDIFLETIPIIWYDNLSIVHLVANLILHSRMKHVELDF